MISKVKRYEKRIFPFIPLCCGVPEDWRSAIIAPLHKSKGERTECSNYRNMVGKICTRILVDKIHKVTEGLINEI